MSKFYLEIEMGNAAMMDNLDVSMALHNVADKLKDESLTSGNVRDINGNGVGHYGFKD